MRPVLCLVTDRRRIAPRGAAEPMQEDALVAYVGLAARAGVHLVQVRERDVEGGALTRLVRRCVDAVRGTPARVVVNDRLDVAIAAGAHGVHLPGNGVPAARVRPVAPVGFLIGRSVHDAREAAQVAADGALDYLVFGTVFDTATKPGVTPAGVRALAETAAAVPLPVLAIGGVTLARLPEIAAAGAAGAAAIGLFIDACAGGPAAMREVVEQAERAFDPPDL